MEIYEIIVRKSNQSLIITLPKPEVQRINLWHTCGIQMWIGDNMIIAKPMLPWERQAENTEVRNVNMSGSSAILVLPPKLTQAFNIRAGDKVRVGCTPDAEKREVFLIKPKEQKHHVRLLHDGPETYVEVYQWNEDGTVNESIPPEKYTVSYEKGHKLEAAIKRGEDPTKDLKKEKKDFRILHLEKPGPDYKDPKFLKRGERQPIRKWEADALAEAEREEEERRAEEMLKEAEEEKKKAEIERNAKNWQPQRPKKILEKRRGTTRQARNKR